MCIQLYFIVSLTNPKMDYNLQKWIEPSFFVPKNNRISSYPSSDFVNPRVGSVARLYSFYEPTHSHKNAHTIEKETDASLLQEGTGENPENDESESST